MICTDLVARGIDISAVKAVLNFSFPTEPKRYLHRVGRTARAGSHGQAVTLCNDEERKDIKKLLRKLNQKLLPYMVPPKLVKLTHEFICKTLDPLMREIQLEEQQDKEIERAYKEAQRAENLVKYKSEIMSRPKTEWHKTYKEKKDLQKESKKDLKNMGSTFEESLVEMSKSQKLRDKKQKRKEEERLEKIAATSAFGADKEVKPKNKGGKGGEQRNQSQGPRDEPVKDKL